MAEYGVVELRAFVQEVPRKGLLRSRTLGDVSVSEWQHDRRSGSPMRERFLTCRTASPRCFDNSARPSG
jgi:hypothetical protein